MSYIHMLVRFVFNNLFMVIKMDIVYSEQIPNFILPFLTVNEMNRLKYVGMNCGCEYTNFPLFNLIEPYSRFEHSLGCALIVWKHTKDQIQTLSALFHDISTPVFAHTVDFLNNDYLKQESTEKSTKTVLTNSTQICELLNMTNILVDDICDYHRFPVADNNSPQLSADRLEYTLGNAYRYGFADISTLQSLYEKIQVAKNEFEEDELCFKDGNAALRFAEISLSCSKVYVSAEDRYSMQILSELLRNALDENIIQYKDLDSTEKEVVNKLENSRLKKDWVNFTSLSHMVDGDNVVQNRQRVVFAKKRYIDPFIIDKGRVSSVYKNYKEEINSFIEEDQSKRICGI